MSAPSIIPDAVLVSGTAPMLAAWPFGQDEGAHAGASIRMKSVAAPEKIVKEELPAMGLI
jgi:hypothetical protein